MDPSRVRRQAPWMAALWGACCLADVAVIVARPHPWIGVVGLPFGLWAVAVCWMRYRKPPPGPDAAIAERVGLALVELCEARSVAVPTLVMVPTGSCRCVKWSTMRTTLPVAEDHVRHLDDRQLAAFMAHSMAHLDDPRLGEWLWVQWIGFGIVGVTAGLLARSQPLEVVGLYPATGLFLVPIALGFPIARLRRQAELRADDGAVADLGADRTDLIDAWRSLYSWTEQVNGKRWGPLRVVWHVLARSGGLPLERRIAVINEAAVTAGSTGGRRSVAGLRRRR